jgi:uncharacterized membrane protein
MMDHEPGSYRRDVPAYVALMRIAVVVGMSTAIATGIFLLLAGSDYVVWGLISLVLALPFFALMRLVENMAAPKEPPA